MMTLTAAPPLRLAIELRSPVMDQLAGFITCNRGTPNLRMIPHGWYAGQRAAIIGAGPSAPTVPPRGVDVVLACNSALGWCVQHGIPITAAVGIDQSPGLLREWSAPPDVAYLVATSCDPALVAHLRAHERTVLFFHNYVGVPDELATYNDAWPPGYVVGEGFTVCSRLVGLCVGWLGIERVDLYGADCAFSAGDVAHANGDTARAAYGAPMIMQGMIDGRMWRTRPDLLREAVHLVRRVRALGGALRLMGDTLPVALLGKSDAFLDAVCRDVPSGTPHPASS